MKILQVTMQFGRSYTQGTERYVATLSDTLRARGHEVQVLAGDPLRLGPKQKLGEPVAGENCLLYYPTRGWMTVLGLRPGRLAARLREHRPDIVHLNTPAHIGVGMMIACNRLGIPCVVTVHDYWWVCPKGTLLRPDGALCDGTPGWATCVRCMAGDHPRGWVRKLAAVPVLSAWLLMKLFSARAMCRGMTMADGWRWMWRRWFLIRQLDLADFAIFPSKAMAMGVASRLSHRRWKVIPNGLPAEWFENPRPPATAVKPPEELTIGYAGALAPHKAPHLLLEAVRLLGWRRTRVRLAGSAGQSVYWRKLQQAAAGLNVDFLGQVTREAMPTFLRSLDVLAITSVCPENFPYVVLEAQAAGVPVVGSDLGGITERIDEDMRFRPGSAEKLAAALDHVRREATAVRLPDVPTAEKMLEATEAVYHQVIGARR